MLTIDVVEGGSRTYEYDLKDGTGAAIPLAQVSALTATLYNKTPEAIINSRDAQSVLNVNGGTYHATNGHGTLDLLAADNPIVPDSGLTPIGKRQAHILLMEVLLTNGKTHKWEVKVRVKNLNQVP
jgi:hypothetical protein